MKNTFAALAILFAVVPGRVSFAGEIPKPIEGLQLRDVRMIPMQSGGRIKPFDEFARELTLAMTGSRSFGGFDPSEMVISMMVQPQLWADVELIRVGNEETRRQLLLDLDRKLFTANELSRNNAFLQYAEGLTSSGSGSQVNSNGIDPVTGGMDPRAEEMKRVVDRMQRFQALVTGQLWMTTPPKDGNPDSAWKPLAAGMHEPSDESNAVYGLLKSYLEKNTDEFAMKALIARDTIENSVPKFDEMKSAMTAEVFYNRLRPFLQAMIFYLIAGILWLCVPSTQAGATASFKHALPRIMAKFLTFAALMLHVLGFGLRCYVAGRPPVTNMYESIIWVSLGVMVFALLLYNKGRQRVLMSTATILSGLALYAADSAPLLMDPTIRPLVAVLRSNYWLTIHVLTITLSYAAFMLAMGISNITLYHFWRGDGSTSSSQKIAALNQINYRALMFGTVLLAAGTILGGIWADYSWGRFWGWDPKEVWALIALLVYIAIIHGRLSGWVGTFAFPLWTVICFSTVVMAWYGVNFVLGKGRHSYGFSSGGQGVVVAYLVLQLIYCIFVAYRAKGRRI